MHLPLYEDVAQRIEGLIESGTLRPGDRVPSVRKLHRQWSVSVSTVLSAYRLLEDRGVLEARPQSGHYVRGQARRLPEPKPIRKDSVPTAVDLRTLMVQLTGRANDLDLVGLGCGTPDPNVLPLDALGRLMAKIARSDRSAFRYEVSPGTPALRRAVATRLLDAGCTLGPDDLVVTGGAQEGMTICLSVLTKPGDTVVVESPTYFGLLQTLEMLGLHAIEVPTCARDGIDLNRLSAVLRDNEVSACALVSNFSNPLGAVMSDARKARLVELLAAADVPLIEDDVYGELGFEGPRPKALKAFDRRGEVLYVSSISKTLSPGLRIGWVAGGNYQKAINERKLVCSLGASTLPQMAIAEYLTSGGFDRHLRRMRKIYRDNAAAFSLAVQRHFPPGTRLSRPKGGQFLWVELPAHVDSLVVFEQAYRAGISIAPGLMFSPTGRYRNFMRLNYSLTWSDDVERAIATLGRLVEAQYP